MGGQEEGYSRRREEVVKIEEAVWREGGLGKLGGDRAFGVQSGFKARRQLPCVHCAGDRDYDGIISAR